MSSNYQNIGFKCGLEIHQQLEGRKLFCNCPTINSRKEADIKIQRKLRALAGETGEVDIAASYEEKKQKYFLYEGNSEDTCLVEIDEEPIHEVSQQALKAALTISLLLNAKLVDEIQFMRKTVVDGSNVSGFQRTALVAQDGYVETSKGKVGIPSICLEEEAAQKLEDTKDYVKYKLDRLGIPLIEIGTDATIQDPEHAKEVAEKLGMILRSVPEVKRGLGTIRQDVNVSITGHPRVEIKGFQELKSIQKTIENEIKRQEKEKTKDPKPHVRKANADFSTTFLRPMPGAARMYVETDARTIKITKQTVDTIKLPELIEGKAKKLEKAGLDKDLAAKIASSGKQEYFLKLFESLKNLKPSFIVDTFSSIPKELQKTEKITADQIKEKDIEKALELVNKGTLPKNNLAAAVADMAKGSFDPKKYQGASSDDLKKEIENIIKEKPGLNPGAYMGLIMAKFKGKVDGAQAMKILKELL